MGGWGGEEGKRILCATQFLWKETPFLFATGLVVNC